MWTLKAVGSTFDECLSAVLGYETAYGVHKTLQDRLFYNNIMDLAFPVRKPFKHHE